MPLKIKKIEEEALRLSPRERAQLAEYLIRSLDEEEDYRNRKAMDRGI